MTNSQERPAQTSDPFAISDEQFRSICSDADTLLRELFPVPRSITGDGVRATLSRLQRVTSFSVGEIPSGTVCYDWTVPDEWHVRSAFIRDLQGNTIVDFADNNVHLVGYSVPTDRIMSFDELKPHLHTIPEMPDAIPYRTSYYAKDWGFCLSHSEFQRMDRSGRYQVRIDADLQPGSLTYGESLLPGESTREILISTYCCHPSLANDNLSGIILWTLLLRYLKQIPLRHSYRFVIVPETIGAIAYLAANAEAMKLIRCGFVVTTVGGPGSFGYKKTFLGTHELDLLVELAFREQELEFVSYPFSVNGSDERQYSSPYFRIPVGTICKDKYYEYKEYHTSLDNLDFISAENLCRTLRLYLRAIGNLERNLTFRSLHPWCEPMLGKRGLIANSGGAFLPERLGGQRTREIIGWLLFHADGKTPLLEISRQTKIPLNDLYDVALALQKGKLLQRIEESP